ncbi:MAG: hypothetical protein IPK50_10015 [Fibrobacterota bacterium]|nr:hypothetical protein [Fibrobacterota bacterium]QQS07213.1 MAG: hypothetical protein IPK50_10015 [Fibrobacterota bacterium]
MFRSILKTVLVGFSVFGLVVGCDLAGSSSGGRGGADANPAEGTWVRTNGASTETVTLLSNGQATWDSAVATTASKWILRYTGTWSGTGTTGSVSLTSASTSTNDGATWSTPAAISAPGVYSFTISGGTATVTVNGVVREFTKKVVVDPTSPPKTDPTPSTSSALVGTWKSADTSIHIGYIFYATGKFAVLVDNTWDTEDPDFAKYEGNYTTSGTTLTLVATTTSSSTNGVSWGSATAVSNMQVSGTYSVSSTSFSFTIPDEEGSTDTQIFKKATSIFPW